MLSSLLFISLSIASFSAFSILMFFFFLAFFVSTLFSLWSNHGKTTKSPNRIETATYSLCWSLDMIWCVQLHPMFNTKRLVWYSNAHIDRFERFQPILALFSFDFCCVCIPLTLKFFKQFKMISANGNVKRTITIYSLICKWSVSRTKCWWAFHRHQMITESIQDKTRCII